MRNVRCHLGFSRLISNDLMFEYESFFIFISSEKFNFSVINIIEPSQKLSVEKTISIEPLSKNGELILVESICTSSQNRYPVRVANIKSTVPSVFGAIRHIEILHSFQSNQVCRSFDYQEHLWLSVYLNLFVHLVRIDIRLELLISNQQICG
jgi:hypothetical protein